jgi:hypothetical protein
MGKKSVLKSSTLKNPEGLSKEHLEALLGYLSRLEKCDLQMAAHAIRHVVDGTDEEVLLTLGGCKEAAETLCLTGANVTAANYKESQHGIQERAKVLHAGKFGLARLWIRLAQVFEAANRAAGKTLPTLPGWPNWFVALFIEIVATSRAQGVNTAKGAGWPLSELTEVLNLAELPVDLIARAVLDQQTLATLYPGYYSYSVITNILSGWQPYLSQHQNVVREALARPEADQRQYAMQALSGMEFDFAPVVDLMVKIATGPAKRPRDLALSLLGPHRDAARPLAEKVLDDGDTAERHEAVLLLWRLCGADTVARLQQHAAQESSERVKQTIEKLLAAPTAASADAAQALVSQLPPVQVELGTVALAAEAITGLRTFFARAHEQALQRYERDEKQWQSPERPQWMGKPTRPEPVAANVVDDLVRFVEGKAHEKKLSNAFRQYTWGKSLGDWVAPPQVQLIHVVRLAYAFEHLQTTYGQEGHIWWPHLQELEAYRGRSPQPFGLRELDAAVASLPGGKPGAIAAAYLAHNTRFASFCDWEPQAIWPIFAERPEVLQEILGAAPGRLWGPARYDYWLPEKRRNAFRVLAMFPQLPPVFIPLLWDLALGDSKSERPLAQAALATLPDKAGKILVALGDGKQAVRAAAAEWLAKIGDPSAIEPLTKAVRQEKQEAVKGAMMAALETLGADVNQFLDRAELLAEAEAGLAKKRPRGMQWIPLDALPPLHWQDTGAAVDRRIVQWWLVQGIQHKSPVAGPLLRRYLAWCRTHEAAALAKFVLAAWIAHDTILPSHEEASARATQEADTMWAQWGQQQHFQNMYDGKKDNLYRQLYQKHANTCKGSAIDQKGMLALVAAAGDGDCVKWCEQYIRKWFGNRLAQCKALVEVLAWLPHPLAIQVLLSLANRFRTKAVRKMAEEYVQALADREGWTIDQLADRTIPDAGFERPMDEQGAPTGSEAVLVLDYGPRQFNVQLDDELQPVITSAEGKTVKNPPAAGKNDDPEKAKAAKKVFTEAKKVVKEVVRRQTERLYEALCTQRSWRFGDWQRYLANHPIVGKLCVRVAWSTFAPGEEDAGGPFLGCFRPLEDGSLTNAQDEEVTFADDTLIRLAHTCNTPPELGEAWAKHFVDYDITPLFQQFGRSTYSLPEDKKKETEVKDFEGQLLTTFKLRGKATKLGYLRGDAEDGGCFYVYRKPFPSLCVQAVIQFTGSCLPEADRPAALEDLYFMSIKGDQEAASSWQPSKLALGKIQAVLLSECYNDVKQIAAEGQGYDPKWRERNYY